MKNTTQRIKNSFTLKKLIPIIIIMLIFSLFTACGSSSGGSSGGLEPDTWYTYKDLDILKVQNCLISSANINSSGKGVTATYIPVCKECHEYGTAWMAAPEVNYPVSKTYTCDKCGAKTTLKFKIQY
ncbi:MAG: hypothetical protein J6L58_00455 [Clostridia bacterium]|nr:hypothetical protein [Clostridia bacterium]